MQCIFKNPAVRDICGTSPAYKSWARSHCCIDKFGTVVPCAEIDRQVGWCIFNVFSISPQTTPHHTFNTLSTHSDPLFLHQSNNQPITTIHYRISSIIPWRIGINGLSTLPLVAFPPRALTNWARRIEHSFYPGYCTHCLLGIRITATALTYCWIYPYSLLDLWLQPTSTTARLLSLFTTKITIDDDKYSYAI